jgi:hypothetical protein
MSTWTSDERSKIAAAEELQLASARRNGTLRRPVTIWVVRHGEDLYVRSAYGRTSTWFRGTQDRHKGQIHAGGVDKDVRFVETDDVNDEIDAAYRTKYRRYAARFVTPMVSPEARAATIKLVPRSTNRKRGRSGSSRSVAEGSLSLPIRLVNKYLIGDATAGSRVSCGSAAHRPAGQTPVRTGVGLGSRGGSPKTEDTSPQAHA